MPKLVKLRKNWTSSCMGKHGGFQLALTEILKIYCHLSFLRELNPNGALCTPKHGEEIRKGYYSKQHSGCEGWKEKRKLNE